MKSFYLFDVRLVRGSVISSVLAFGDYAHQPITNHLDFSLHFLPSEKDTKVERTSTLCED